MAETGKAKKIGIAVILIVLAIGIFFWQFSKGQEHEVGRLNVPPGSAPKIQAMKAMQGKGNASGPMGGGAMDDPPGASRPAGQ